MRQSTPEPYRLPAPLRRAGEAFLAERFPKATPGRRRAWIAALSEAFTAEREALPGSYLNRPEARSAYLAFFHPQQVIRGIAALDETKTRAAARGLWPGAAATAERPLRVLDAGAGLGAMTQALVAVEPDTPLDVVLVDHQKSGVADARDLTAACISSMRPKGAPPRVRTAVSHLEPWVKKAAEAGWTYDLVLVGGVLNELRGAWPPLVRRLLAVLDPAAPGGGMLVTVEPAIPKVARQLQELRDDLLGETTTVAPCTHGAECPLAKLIRDWCFTVRPAELPRAVAEEAARLGHQTSEIRFAFWAACGRPDAAPFEHPPGAAGRIVSDPVPGGQVVCCEGERERLPESAPRRMRGEIVLR
ncbi:MAG: hypothetical protein HMLKMBBP_01035 [Planctomycetes bacterium]|nr:hypothetical protein [Planctomycetota bacterium]